MTSDEVVTNVLGRQQQEAELDRQRLETALAGREIVRFGDEDGRFRNIIFLDEAYNDMLVYGTTNRNVERAGALFGFHCGDCTVVARFIGSGVAEGRTGEVDFVPTVWGDFLTQNDSLDQLHDTEYKMVAWFHTHPIGYPSAPYSSHDRFIMSGYFAISDKDSLDDKSTVIMTPTADNSTPTIAVWKWDPQRNRAVLVNGIKVAVRAGSSVQSLNYYFPGNESARVVEGTLGNVVVDLDGPTTSGVTGQPSNVFKLELDQQPGEVVTVELRDLNPDPNVLEVSLGEITPPIARQLVDYLNRNPDGRTNKVARSLLRAARAALPVGLQGDIDLVLGQTTPIEEQIQIL